MAPRKPRYRTETRQIEIERNPIERFLLDTKDFVKKHRKLVLVLMISAFTAALLAIGAVVIADIVNTRNEKRLEKIMSRQVMSAIMGGGDTASAVKDLRAFIDDTWFGFPRSLAYYALGNIYFSRKEYAAAKENLATFAKNEKKSILAPLAMLKAAIALEEAGDVKGALEIYRQMEEDFGEGALADQVFYNYARVCGKSGDMFNARKYYHRVISSFPESAYAAQAKKRLFMLGAR